jgi:hypothetical protein
MQHALIKLHVSSSNRARLVALVAVASAIAAVLLPEAAEARPWRPG